MSPIERHRTTIEPPPRSALPQPTQFGRGRKVWTPRRYRSQVENDQCEAQRIGAQGTSFLVIDGRYTVPGAICTDDLRRPDQSRPDQLVLRDARKRWSRMGCGP